MRISPIVVFIFVLSPTYTLVVQGLSSPIRTFSLISGLSALSNLLVLRHTGKEERVKGLVREGPNTFQLIGMRDG